MPSQNNAVNEVLHLPLADAFERELQTRLAEECDVVIAMIDLDAFMRVNQLFGSDEGDRVLIELGEYLRKSLPEGTLLYRYGGDEFACVFAGKVEKEDALLALEEIRRGYDRKLPDGSAVTISAGIAAAQEDASLYTELVRMAEGAMFRGKTNGKNRVCLAREEKMVTKTSHYTQDQLKRLTKVSKREGIGEAILLREALDALLHKYDA